MQPSVCKGNSGRAGKRLNNLAQKKVALVYGVSQPRSEKRCLLGEAILLETMANHIYTYPSSSEHTNLGDQAEPPPGELGEAEGVGQIALDKRARNGNQEAGERLV